ncbi:MAG: ABC transporter ATP-binding protein, partial [Nitrospinota bacterium]
FDLYAGEVVALLGENGAGKTTLMNIVYGFHHPDAGTIEVRGERVRFRSPKDAIARGIGMVHQHLTLVPPHTVLENIILGLPTGRGPLLDRRRSRERIREFADRYGLHIDPDVPVWQLSVGERQRIEILKALYRGAEILILDEPTAVLTPQESRELAATLRRLAEAGHAIVYISHKLKEVFEVSGRVVVLRRGKVVARRRTDEVDQAELARLMVGREVLERLERPDARPGSPVLEVRDLRALNDKGLPALRGVSFDVREGEILGVAGVSGNGQGELADVISGLRPATAGTVRLDGVEITNRTPREIVQSGVGRVPEDRMTKGLLLDLPLTDNTVLASYRERPVSRAGIMSGAAIHAYAERLIEEFDVRTPSVTAPAATLSGGNLQKLLLARELSLDVKLLIASQPTRGLDVGAMEYIHNKLLEQKARGLAILLISEDLDEILLVSDRIAVMYNGEIMNVVDARSAEIGQLGLWMAGVRPSAESR